MAQTKELNRKTNIRAEIESYFDQLWPLCRSLTGEGYRESLDILSEIIPTERLKFKTGEKVFDWTVPKEWVIRDAYIVDPQGEKHCEFKKNNLHILNYSIPFRGKMSFSELKNHLHTLPNQPNAIPYLSSYYKERWGFCLTHDEFLSLPDGEYQVVVDTEMIDGHLEVGEAVIQGENQKEILFSMNLCHPSLANNELSGPLVGAFLYQKIKALPKRNYTYRFVYVPETLGAICYLRERGEQLRKKLVAGYVLTCIGDKGKFTYKLSRHETSTADRAAQIVLRDLGAHEIIPFDPSEGSDEGQYCSPGFNLPVGSLMRTRYLTYPEYHTSLDNKNFISFEAILESVETCFQITQAIETNVIWKNAVMYGEPQLGKRGLYEGLGGHKNFDHAKAAMMWLLNLADGTRDLLEIAKKSGQRLDLLAEIASKLEAANLLSRSSANS